MSKNIRIKKGLDIKLVGEASREINRLPLSESHAVSPPGFEGVTPKLLVSVGDRVLAGGPLFFDKARPEVLFTSPVSGTVSAVVRGEKRRILEVVVDTDGCQESEKFDTANAASKEDVTAILLKSGLWPAVIQRPYGIIANPQDTPKAIFVSGFDSAPLAPDMNFVLGGRLEDLQAGFDALRKLTKGKVHLGLKKGADGVLNQIKGVEATTFQGPHPAGNVGVQINHIDPINKGEVVWTVDVQNVAVIGRLFRTGKLDMTKTYALTGSETVAPMYVESVAGAPYVTLLRGEVRHQEGDRRIRVVEGNPLSGRRANPRGYIGFYANQITLLPEGDRYEFLGWAMPRLDKFSVSRAYFSWLCPKKRYTLDTNMNGGHRPFIVTGLFERYFPMDIYPMYLLKAMITKNIDKMENYGIYEVVPEDFALCEFVDPSKNDIQQIVRDGINLMIKELS